MKKCIIVGSSKDSQKNFVYNKDDFIIASDGGYAYLKENNYPIDLVIGDFDSLKYIPECENKIILNPIKDVSDTHAAIEEAISREYTSFELYGCLGGRIDHSIAIIQDCSFYAKKGIKIKIIGSNQTIEYLYNDKIVFSNKEGYISVFAIGIAKGVTIKNLKYELNNETLSSDFPLGLSNEFINKKATIEVKDGCLILIY